MCKTFHEARRKSSLSFFSLHTLSHSSRFFPQQFAVFSSPCSCLTVHLIHKGEAFISQCVSSSHSFHCATISPTRCKFTLAFFFSITNLWLILVLLPFFSPSTWHFHLSVHLVLFLCLAYPVVSLNSQTERHRQMHQLTVRPGDILSPSFHRSILPISINHGDLQLAHMLKVLFNWLRMLVSEEIHFFHFTRLIDTLSLTHSITCTLAFTEQY